MHTDAFCNLRVRAKGSRKRICRVAAAPFKRLYRLYRGEFHAAQNHQNRPPGLTTGLFDFRIGSGVFLLSAIASSTASGVLCGPISGHKKIFQLDKCGFTPHLAKVEWLSSEPLKRDR